MQVSSDFIYMASELMYIKSRMLLPVLPKDEDPRQPLVDALLEYSRAKQASEFLKTQSDIYYDRFVKQPFEKPTVGILLCKEKKDAFVELTLPKDSNIYATEYALYLPDKKELQQKLQDWIEEFSEE